MFSKCSLSYDRERLENIQRQLYLWPLACLRENPFEHTRRFTVPTSQAKFDDMTASSTALYGSNAWLPDGIREAAADHTLREVRLPEETEWLPHHNGQLETRLLEVSQDRQRTVAEIRAMVAEAVLPVSHGIEMFVQRGTIRLNGEPLSKGLYLRVPPDSNNVQEIRLESDALVALATGQIQSSDTESRIIDTTDDSAWFEGPAKGVEVLPLHGHGTATIILVRWQVTAAFHPNLDPIGEELLVLNGALHDSSGSYPAGSWIRNPVPTWQAWAGTPGTLVWYKSGHFPASHTVARVNTTS